ncbi:MAG: glycosyltransferase family 2 protein [Polyangiaceae bacterium]|nr:glycosyltransferase family 2 protein [Polyangiaceae bacterium]
MSARVSVLCCVHNGGPHLEAAIRSILVQSFRDFELILIDDGSTDDSPTVLDALGREDPRAVVIHQANVGLTRALNIGLRLATGEYVVRQDADDLSLPRRIEAQVAHLERHPRCVVVGCRYLKIDDTGEVQGHGRPPLSDLGIKLRLLDRNALAHSAATYRRRPVLDLGGYDAGFRTAQDYDLWCRLATIGKLRNLRQPLLLRREHPRRIGVRLAADQQESRVIIRERYRRDVLAGRVGNGLLRGAACLMRT